MIAGSIARRYARALLAIGIDSKSFDALQRELERVAEVYSGSADLASTLENPVFPLARRKAVVDEIGRRLALSKTIRNFLMLLLDRGRIDALPAIAREHRALVDEHAGRVRARVTSVQPLAPGAEARLKSALEHRTGKVVVIERQQDPSLIGGVVTQIGDLVFDGSVRTQLAELKRELIAG